MATFQCPYCQAYIALTPDTHVPRYMSFYGTHSSEEAASYAQDAIKIDYYHCPNCQKYTVKASGISGQSDTLNLCIRPRSLAKQFPDYVPQAIRNDYEEAYAIVNLSPKASATLSRRCLQGMIRDFFEVKEKTLYAEIDAIKDQIPPKQWAVLDGVRKIGNIGAHMEKDINCIVDIDPEEAEKLLKLIELLIDQWYIQRHDQEELYKDIIEIDQAKQSDRKNAQ